MNAQRPPEPQGQQTEGTITPDTTLKAQTHQKRLGKNVPGKNSAVCLERTCVHNQLLI